MLEWKDNTLLKHLCLKICYKNVWRVKPLCIDVDDLMQECWIIYNTCVNKYTDLEDAQFVALLKRSINNMINDLSTEASKHNDTCVYFEEMETESVFDLEKEVDFRIKMALAPKIIKNIISILSSNTEDELKRKGWSRNKILKKLFGYDNLIEKTKKYIKE